MLECYKKIYTEKANEIPGGWKDKSKSEIIRDYCQAKKDNSPLIDAYMSAIMLKYWGALTNYYRKSHSSKIRVEDFYDWLTEAILTVVTKPVFDDEYLCLTYKKTGEVRKKPNKLYGKENAPDIAMIRCLYSMRQGFYQASNYDVRKLNYMETHSIEGLIEEKKSYILPVSNLMESEEHNLNIKDLIKKAFESKQYSKAFVMEGIIDGDVFDTVDGVSTFNKKKLAKHLRFIDDSYCDLISKYFDIDKDLVLEAKKSLPSKNNGEKFYRIIDSSLSDLKLTIKDDLGLEA